MTTPHLEDCDVLILCGGKGTRLQSVVRDRPKPMVVIDGRPFVDRLVDLCERQGVRRMIFCTGYLGDQVAAWYAGHPRTCEFVFSRERTPLGTAGAVKHAAGLIRSNPFLVMNGDSICQTDLRGVLACHAAAGGPATVTLTPADTRTDAGCVTMDRHGRLTAFAETHAGSTAPYHNAGIYVFDRSVLDLIPPGQAVSLEQDLLPGLLGSGAYGYVSRQPLYDIGTPERLAAYAGLACGDTRSEAGRGRPRLAKEAR